MKVQFSYNERLLKFEFIPEENETVGKKVKLGNNHCQFLMPEDFDVATLHKDVLALAIILLIYPFSGNTVELPFGISKEFSDTLKRLIKKDVIPINTELLKNQVVGDSKIALAYSGGVDSTAALTILPESTILYFIDRKIPEGTTTMYSKDAPYKACETLKKMGRTVYDIVTDFEYVRDPIGFPIDVACAIPGLLLSKHDQIDSIAMGMIMESAYRIGHENYEDYANRWHYKVWGGLFEAVGIPLNLVVAGISEVGTEKIVQMSQYHDLAQSCMRAINGIPCMKCMKCLRKRLLEKTLKNEWISQEFLETFFKNTAVQKLLMTSPMKHQDVLIYITSHYQGEYEPMLLLKKKMGGDTKNVDWIEKWYSPSNILIPIKYRETIEENIKKYLSKMTIIECEEVEAWNLHPFLESQLYEEISNDFERLLKTL